MEPECSLSQSQAPFTCPYPEPEQSSPCLPSYVLQINFNIILPSIHRTSKWSFSLGSPQQDPVCTFTVSHTRHILHTCHYPLFYHPNNIWWRIQIILIYSSLCIVLHTCVNSSFLGQNSLTKPYNSLFVVIPFDAILDVTAFLNNKYINYRLTSYSVKYRSVVRCLFFLKNEKQFLYKPFSNRSPGSFVA
jgi:hypothetical protein